MSQAPATRSSSTERLDRMIEALDIPEARKGMLRERWLDQLEWTSRQARKARRRYLAFRIPVVIGGVAIPALITILLSSGTETHLDWLFGIETTWVRLVSFAVSLLVAMLAAVEETMRFGDRWRHYRKTAELLKTLGWQYLMLNGTFRRYANHNAAFASFTERVEDVLNEDVEGYLSAVAREGREQERHEIVV